MMAHAAEHSGKGASSGTEAGKRYRTDDFTLPRTSEGAGLPGRDQGAPRFRRAATAITAAALLAAGAAAQVKVTLGGDVPAVGPGTRYPTLLTCNETNSPQQVAGWKFKTRDYAGYTTWMTGLTKSGTAPVEYTQPIPASEQQMQSNSCRSAPTDYTGTLAANQDATPFDLQALVKTGTCSEIPPYKDADAMACDAVEGARAAAGFYGNQCLVDTIGSNGGDTYGGFVSSWFNQTQIQAAIPSNTITVSMTPVRWDPYRMGPQYMMALGMAQEILNVDMQFLIAIAGKETGAGMVNTGTNQVRSEDGSYTDNGTFGYWQVEEATFGTYIKAYPQFFPKYGPCISKYRDVTQAITAGCAPGWGEVAKFYMQPAGQGKMTPNSPQIVGGVFASALAWYGLYDALALSTDLCFIDAIKNGVDKRIAFAAMIGGYNLGRWTGFGDPLKDPALKNDPNASSRFPIGNNNYRTDIYNILDYLLAASRNCASRRIYDTTLTLTEVQRFLFGGSGATPGTAAAQGDGGLMLHYDLAPDARAALWADVQCAFDRLKGKAPSTAGKDGISYRYDWLTLLRVVKKHLPFHIKDRKVPVEHDFEYVVNKYSTGTAVCGSAKPKDNVFPSFTITTPAAQGLTLAPIDTPGFKVAFKASDNVGVAKAEWSLDRNWLAWNPATNVGGVDWEFHVSCERPDYPKGKGQKAALWIRTTDACGNSTVGELAFTTHSTASCGDPPVPPQVATPSATPSGREFSALSPGVNVTLNVATPGALILYTTDGSEPDTVAGGATKAYAGPILIASTTTLKARATAAGLLPSAVMTEVYTEVEPGKTPVPVALPKGQNFTGSLQVTLAVPGHPKAVILYTLDGSVPAATEGGATRRYAGPLTLTETATITAVAAEEGLYPSDRMVERYTNIPPVGIQAAWYLDEDQDGRIEKAVVRFDKALTVLPEKLGFAIQGEDGQTHAKTAARAEMALAAGDAARLVVTFATPFPYGVTSVRNAPTSGEAFRQDDIPLMAGKFPVADSVAPIIVKAVVKEEEAGNVRKTLALTYSEPVDAPPASQTAWIFKKGAAELAPAQVTLASAAGDGALRTVLAIDTASAAFPSKGDSVAFATSGEVKDKLGRAPAAKTFRVLEGDAPKSKPVRFAILFPNGSADKPAVGAPTARNPAVFIPLDQAGNPLAGTAEQGRCPACVARDANGYVGPVLQITTPGPLAYEFRIFNNMGEFVASGKGRVSEDELKDLKKDRTGSNWELPVVWTGLSSDKLGSAMQGRKAATGAYIVLANFLLEKDVRTGAGPVKHTDKKTFGLLRSGP